MINGKLVTEETRPGYDNSEDTEPGNLIFDVCTCEEVYGDDPLCSFHGEDPSFALVWRPV